MRMAETMKKISPTSFYFSQDRSQRLPETRRLNGHMWVEQKQATPYNRWRPMGEAGKGNPV